MALSLRDLAVPQPYSKPGMWHTINSHLNRYRDKRVAVLYSAGFDSSFLAHHLLHTARAAEVALILLDYGEQNNYRNPWADRSQPEDLVRDVWQFEHYASLLQRRRRFGLPDYQMWRLPTTPLNPLIVKPDNLISDGGDAGAQIEAEHGLPFWAGFVLIQLSTALGVAAAQGYDHVVTGHMAWNEHYRDESAEFVTGVNALFASAYGSRLQRVPTAQMPFRTMGCTKADLILYNAACQWGMDERDTISCNTSVLDEANGVVKGFEHRNGQQIHCGRCPHCLDRRAQFAHAGVPDRAEYAEA